MAAIAACALMSGQNGDKKDRGDAGYPSFHNLPKGRSPFENLRANGMGMAG
jgi:hypothetical protein